MDPFDYGNQHVISSKTVGHVGITLIACWPPPPTFWNIFRVVDLTLNQAAKPWFHQYLDPYHLWWIVSETVEGTNICNLEIPRKICSTLATFLWQLAKVRRGVPFEMRSEKPQQLTQPISAISGHEIKV